MQTQILELLNKENRSYTELQISRELRLGLKDTCDTLRTLELEGQIHFTKKGEYLSIKYTNLKIGRLEVKKGGYGFVLLKNESDIRIKEEDMNGAIHNDLVAVDGEKIVKVIERNLKNFVGEFVSSNNENFVIIDSKYKLEIIIDNVDRKEAVDGSKVVVEPYEKIKGNKYKGKILEVIGHKNDPKTDILSIIYEHEIKKDFSEETIKEVENISFELKEEDHLNRRDIRDKKVFTIDGDDAKDFDDALSIDVLENGNYLVGIHIADVTHYIKEGGALEKELVERGTSVYLANSVIPMIPKKLSNDICSLNPNVDRLCLSLNVELDKEGKIKNYEIYESVINSKKRMTYKEVNEILDNKNVVNGYENFVSELELLNLLSKKLISKRKSRGGLDFNIPEQKWIVDDNDEPIELLLRTSGTGEKLIEAFMILANEVVAEHVFNLDLPFIYRVHEKPELEKVKKFLILLNNLGYKIAVKIRQITPKDMQMILDKIKDSKIFSLLSEFAVRSTKKAEYKVENLGHFGLASRIYTHFTSPIRRSPDCSIHGVLKKYLKGQRLSSEDLKIIRERLIYISERASYKERQAIECERDVNDMLSAKYMSNKIGQEFDGIIAGIIPNGMFVRLENYIEGMVRLDSLDDYYVFDEPSMSLRGRKSKKSYKLGDKIRVKTVSTSKEEKTIDFEVVKVKK